MSQAAGVEVVEEKTMLFLSGDVAGVISVTDSLKMLFPLMSVCVQRITRLSHTIACLVSLVHLHAHEIPALEAMGLVWVSPDTKLSDVIVDARIPAICLFDDARVGVVPNSIPVDVVVRRVDGKDLPRVVTVLLGLSRHAAELTICHQLHTGARDYLDIVSKGDRHLRVRSIRPGKGFPNPTDCIGNTNWLLPDSFFLVSAVGTARISSDMEQQMQRLRIDSRQLASPTPTQFATNRKIIQAVLKGKEKQQ